MQLKNGCMAVKLLDFIGLCGEVPVSLVRMLPGYYDYNRRVVTALIWEGYLKERRIKGYRRRIVRSLSLTELGSKQLQRVSPGRAQRVHSHALAPENGHGSWKKTLRLHRGAACLLTAMRLRAIWQPGSQKESAMGQQLVYFSAYELTLRLMKLVLDEMALYRFQRYLQQNGICKASMLPLYLFSLELLSEAYALKKGKQMRAELDRGTLFSCQADVVKRICNTGPNLITIPDKWLLDLDTERDDSSDELLLSPNATFLSQQSGM